MEMLENYLLQVKKYSLLSAEEEIALSKKIKDGQVTGIYLISYGIIRFFIESLRQDSLMLFDLKVAQLISILMIFIGLYLFIKPYIKNIHFLLQWAATLSYIMKLLKMIYR